MFQHGSFGKGGRARRPAPHPPTQQAFRLSASTGRPLGAADFVAKLERDLGQALGRRKPGRKAKVATLDQAELP